MRRYSVAVTLVLFMATAAAWATPITSFSLSHVGSAIEVADNPPFASLWSSDPSPHFSYLLDLTSSGSVSTFTGGGFTIHSGSTYVYAHVPSATLANGIVSGSFYGDEVIRLAPGDWVYYVVTGTLAQTVDFRAADGTGTVAISSAVFGGRYPVVPEPSTWALLGAGLVSVLWQRRLLLRHGRARRNLIHTA